MVRTVPDLVHVDGTFIFIRRTRLFSQQFFHIKQQLLDAFFWATATERPDDVDTVPCTKMNLYFTKIVVSLAVFSQVIAITVFPSYSTRQWCNQFRKPYRILPLIGALSMAYFGKCTYSTVTSGGLLELPTLVYWGFIPTPLLFHAGVALWSIAALLFITPWWAATNILLVGGLNLVILTIIDGTILLVSKLCFYCLLLSILWLLEPLWCSSSPVVSSFPLLCKPSAQHVDAVCVNKKRYISI